MSSGKLVKVMRCAVMPMLAACFLTVVLAIVSIVYALPFAKQQLDKIIVTIEKRPAPSGSMQVARDTISIVVALEDGRRDGHIPIDIWYPLVKPVVSSENNKSLDASRAAPVTRETITPGNENTPEGDLPVILYTPGWDGQRADNIIAFRNLASHGYVVITIDDIGYDTKHHVQWSDELHPAASQGFDMSSEDSLTRSIDVADQRLALMVRKVSLVLDELSGSSRMYLPKVIRTRLNLTHVGMFGFSFGGSVAAEITRFDERFIAVANLDGWLFGESAKRGVSQPYLIFNSDFPNIISASKTGQHKKRATARLTLIDRERQKNQVQSKTSYSLFFKKVEHVDFTDYLFTPSLKSMIKFWRRSEDDRLQLRTIMDGYLLSFFDKYMRSKTTIDSPLGKPSRFPDVKDFNSSSPVDL